MGGYGAMVIWVVEFSRGIQNWKGFWPKINILQGNYLIMWIDVVATCQKLGIIFEKKMLQKLKC